jgi:hypothetical protein
MNLYMALFTKGTNKIHRCRSLMKVGGKELSIDFSFENIHEKGNEYKNKRIGIVCLYLQLN